METKEYIESIDNMLFLLDIAIDRINMVKNGAKEILDDMADKENLIKCQACDHYVPEDYIVDFYGEDICLDCRGNGYGK